MNDQELVQGLLELGPLLGTIEKLDKYRILFTNGSVYYGDMVDGEMHGHGEFVWKSGTRYLGEFQYNRITGCGEMSWLNGGFYSGKWSNNKRDGYGELRLPSGVRYNGEFKNGLPHGQGKMTYSSLSEYNGMFHLGLKHGYGVFLFEDGSVYDGEWKGGLRHGSGIMKWQQESYNGQWFNGRIEGYGKYIWHKIKATDVYYRRNMYKGWFHANKKHGMGKLYFADGSFYDGMFQNDLKHGKCLYVDRYGSKYSGLFKLDNPVMEIISKPCYMQETVVFRHIKMLDRLYREYSTCIQTNEDLVMTRETWWLMMIETGIRNSTSLDEVDVKINHVLKLKETKEQDKINFREFIYCLHAVSEMVFKDFGSYLNLISSRVPQRVPNFIKMWIQKKQKVTNIVQDLKRTKRGRINLGDVLRYLYTRNFVQKTEKAIEKLSELLKIQVDGVLNLEYNPVVMEVFETLFYVSPQAFEV